MNSLVVILLAAVAANLPFASERIFFIKRPAAGGKAFIWRLLELIVLYFVVGGIGHLIEASTTTPQPQHWQFYVVTACVFLVFAFPGFIARYLWRNTRLG